MVYEDEVGLLDLPLPKLVGRHQIENAGVAIAALRHAGRGWGADAAVEKGLATVEWPGRLQRLHKGPLVEAAPKGAEVWLDGGHNPHGAEAVSRAMADMEEHGERPLYLICGMLANKDALGYLARLGRPGAACGDGGDPRRSRQPGRGRACTTWRAAPGWTPRRPKTWTTPCCRSAPGRGWTIPKTPPRILICGSLYLAGKVLAENS